MFNALAIEFVPFFHNTPCWWSKLKEICVKKDPTPKKGKVENPKPINIASFPTMQIFLKTGKKNFKLWYDYSTVNKFSWYSGSLKLHTDHLIIYSWGFVFCSFKRVHAGTFMLACALFNEQNKVPILLSIITWFVLGKQNVQAKKVYFLAIWCINCR